MQVTVAAKHPLRHHLLLLGEEGSCGCAAETSVLFTALQAASSLWRGLAAPCAVGAICRRHRIEQAGGIPTCGLKAAPVQAAGPMLLRLLRCSILCAILLVTAHDSCCHNVRRSGP